MATIQFKSGDKYLAKISRLERGIKDELIGPAVYEGAAIVTDAISERLSAVPTDESWGSTGDLKNGPRKIELLGLQKSLGIAKLRDEDGFMNVKVGFDGYNGVKTAKWPNGQPNQMIARSVERGTSFMQANPVVKPAVSQTRKQVINTMKEKVDENIEKIMKG